MLRVSHTSSISTTTSWVGWIKSGLSKGIVDLVERQMPDRNLIEQFAIVVVIIWVTIPLVILYPILYLPWVYFSIMSIRYYLQKISGAYGRPNDQKR